MKAYTYIPSWNLKAITPAILDALNIFYICLGVYRNPVLNKLTIIINAGINNGDVDD